MFESEVIGLKRGDEVIYVGGDNRLVYGKKYIIDDILDLQNNKFVTRDFVSSDYDFLALLEDGKAVKDKDGTTRVFMAYDFLTELEFNTKKYNI
jgi:hypothetical protein